MTDLDALTVRPPDIIRRDEGGRVVRTAPGREPKAKIDRALKILQRKKARP